MPPSKNFDGFKDLIQDLYIEKNLPISEVLTILANEPYHFKVSRSALFKALGEWDMRKNNSNQQHDSTQLRMRIASCYFLLCLKDEEIVAVLNDEGMCSLVLLPFLVCIVIYAYQTGYTITKRTMQMIRRDMGLPQRIRSVISIEEATVQLTAALEKELVKGYVGSYGRDYLFRHLRAEGIPATRTRAFAILKQLDPEGVQNRRPTFRRNRDRVGRLEVPGPNYMWCVDGHLKFREYGIGIYAIIDAYSRYVVAVFVGSSVTTAVSVVKQMVNALESTGVRPEFFRSDRGSETMLLANAQLQFEQFGDPNATIGSCYRYGTSKSNSRIESWWNQMSAGQTMQWRVREMCSSLNIKLITDRSGSVNSSRKDYSRTRTVK
jgi:transposase InsO family protein